MNEQTEVTPGRWQVSGSSIISTDPDALKLCRSYEQSGMTFNEAEDYGGKLICESISAADAQHIVDLHNGDLRARAVGP